MQTQDQDFKLSQVIDELSAKDYKLFRKYVKSKLGWSNSKWFNKANEVTPLTESEKICLEMFLSKKSYK